MLVNNAGIAGPTARVEDVTPEALSRTLKIDLEAMFHCARKAVPALRAAGGGSIVNLSSAAGRFGFPLRSPYAAAKWGVIGFTKSMAIELGPDGIRVNAILPGLVAGDRIRRVLEAKAQAARLTSPSRRRRQLRPSRCAATSPRRTSPTWRCTCAALSARPSAASRWRSMATCNPWCEWPWTPSNHSTT